MWKFLILSVNRSIMHATKIRFDSLKVAFGSQI